MTEWMNIAEMAEEQPEKRLHLERYEYAASVLKGKSVLDCSCGMGYGTDLMAAAGVRALGMDIDPEAISTARQLYRSRAFIDGDITKAHRSFLGRFEALVSFETLEHLASPAALLNALPEAITELILSVPVRPTVGWNPWHKSDFTHGSFCSMIEAAGFRIVYVRSQPWVDGKGDLYLMVHAKRGNWTL